MGGGGDWGGDAVVGDVEEAVRKSCGSDLVGYGFAVCEGWAGDAGDVDYGDFVGEGFADGGVQDLAGDGAVG